MKPPVPPSALIIPFGKHKGTTVAELLAKDPAYADWVTAQGWVAERFAELHAALLSRGAGVDDTPEHNALQGRFLDPAFCDAALRTLFGRELAAEAESLHQILLDSRNRPVAQQKIVDWAQKQVEEAKRGPWMTRGRSEQQIAQTTAEMVAQANADLDKEVAKIRAIQAQIDALPAIPRAVATCSVAAFESRGVDVVLRWIVKAGEISHAGWLNLELKPTLGDDYPSVMRQMEALKCRHVVVGTYNGRGLSEPQLRQMFATNRMRLVFLQEIEEAMPRPP